MTNGRPFWRNRSSTSRQGRSKKGVKAFALSGDRQGGRAAAENAAGSFDRKGESIMSIVSSIKRKMSFQDADHFEPGSFNPGLFETNKQKVKKLYPHANSPLVMVNGPVAETLNGICQQMNDGDLSTGVVVSADPLLVACYSGDHDAVALLCYPAALGAKLGWAVGTRLLTVNGFNGYGLMKRNRDLDIGMFGNDKFKTFGPLVAELYTDNEERIARKKAEIPEHMWQRTEELGKKYLQDHPGMARDGCRSRFDDARPIEQLKLKCDLG